jgi:hypothetical protein
MKAIVHYEYGAPEVRALLHHSASLGSTPHQVHLVRSASY